MFYYLIFKGAFIGQGHLLDHLRQAGLWEADLQNYTYTYDYKKQAL